MVMDAMDGVFRKAKDKAVAKIFPPQYTDKPWIDFPPTRLQDRLIEEFNEWKNAHPSEDKEELLDIINMAIFLYLSRSEFPFREQTKDTLCKNCKHPIKYELGYEGDGDYVHLEEGYDALHNLDYCNVSNQELADKGQWVCGCETPED